MLNFEADFEIIEKTMRDLIERTSKDTTESDVYECVLHKIRNIKGYKCETCTKRDNNMACPVYYSKRNNLSDDWYCADCKPLGVGAGGIYIPSHKLKNKIVI